MRRLMVGLLAGGTVLLVGCSTTTQAGPARGQTAQSDSTHPMTMSQMVDPGKPAAGSAVRQLDPADFAAQTPQRLTINVHIPDEGSLPDTDLAIPYDQISARQGELPRAKSAGLAIYCMTGTMSAIAGQTLADLGYTDIVELRGGMQASRAAGLPFIGPS